MRRTNLSLAFVVAYLFGAGALATSASYIADRREALHHGLASG